MNSGTVGRPVFLMGANLLLFKCGWVPMHVNNATSDILLLRGNDEGAR
jgi:hypothetical protein